MPKQVIIAMQEDYPFGQCQECTNQTTKVLVRRILKVSLQQRNKLMEKVNVLRRLNNQHMIKVESVLQEQQSIHFLFQYIPIKLETWISNINEQFIQNFRDQLIKFSSFLANNYIQTKFHLKNIGMDQNYGAKYFLDINFELNTNTNREHLKSNYIRQITSLFKPYILNLPKLQPTLDNKGQIAKSNQCMQSSQAFRKQELAISPPTNKQNIEKKEKALQNYSQQVNISVDSENQKILQEFMDVLDNQTDQAAIYHPVSTLQPQFKRNKASIVQQTSRNKQNSQNYGIQSSKDKQIYSQKQFQQNNLQRQVNFSKKHILTSKSIEGPFFNSQIQQQSKKALKSAQSMGRNKCRMRNMSEIWRQSADLQNRVKDAIEKSMNVVKKFKIIKQSYKS